MEARLQVPSCIFRSWTSHSSGGATGGEDMDLASLAWGERNGPGAQPRCFFFFSLHGRPLDPSSRGKPDEGVFNRRSSPEFSCRSRTAQERPLRVPSAALHSCPSGRSAGSSSSPRPPHRPHHPPLTNSTCASRLKTAAFTSTKLFPSQQLLHVAGQRFRGKGFHTVEATLLRDGQPLSTYPSACWMRDWQTRLSGPKLTVSSDYFELDDKPLPILSERPTCPTT